MQESAGVMRACSGLPGVILQDGRRKVETFKQLKAGAADRGSHALRFTKGPAPGMSSECGVRSDERKKTNKEEGLSPMPPCSSPFVIKQKKTSRITGLFSFSGAADRNFTRTASRRGQPPRVLPRGLGEILPPYPLVQFRSSAKQKRPAK